MHPLEIAEAVGGKQARESLLLRARLDEARRNPKPLAFPSTIWLYEPLPKSFRWYRSQK